MGSKSPSKKKRKSKSSREDSVKFEVRPFSDFGTSPTQGSPESQDSDHSWMGPYLVPESPTPNRSKTEVKNKSQTQEPAKVISLISPQKAQTAPPLQSHKTKTREPVVNAKSMGTGPHDDRLTQSQGDYREPSLRRGSGATVQTPDNMRKNITKRKEKNEWIKGPTQTTAAAQTSTNPQSSTSCSTQQKRARVDAADDQYGMTKSRERRGDVNPVGHRKLAVVQKPSTKTEKPDASKSNESHVQNKSDQAVPKASATKTPEQTPSGSSGATITSDRVQVLKICLDLQEKYLDMEDPEEEFWKAVSSRVESEALAYKPENHNSLKQHVNNWCSHRRRHLRDGIVVAPTSMNLFLEHVDEWNKVCSRRFCYENRGYLEAAGWVPKQQSQSQPQPSMVNFENTFWPAVQDKILSFVERKLLEWTENMLAERMEELEALTRPPLLKANSSPESYQLYVEYLRNRAEAAGRNSVSIRKTEAVMSWAMSLEPGLEKLLRKQLQRVGDNHEDGDGGHDSDEAGDDDDIYSATDEDMSYNGDSDAVSDEDEEIVLPSIEPRTPVVTPRSMAQLYNYEHKYLEALRAATSQKEAQYRALQYLDSTQQLSKKRKEPEGSVEHGHGTGNLTIRSKKGEPEHREAAATTPTPAPRKRQRLEETLASSPSTTSSSSEFPSLAELLSSNIGRASSAITQPSSPTTGPVLSQTVRKSKTPRGANENTDLVSNPLVRDSGRKESPNLFVTPDPPVSGRTNKQFTFKRSVSHSANPNGKEAQHGQEMPFERFRELTADFEAMTPNSRERMLYHAVKTMRK